jgi:ribosome-binding protein aMBF1 (putative translation factor)
MPKALSETKADLLKNPGVRAAYEEMTPEFQLAREVIKARTDAGLSQSELAERMGTTQPFVARLESGNTFPSIRTLLKVAKATGKKPVFGFQTAT